MQEDHIAGLIKAIDGKDDDGVKHHLTGLAYQVINLLERATAALEKTAGIT